MQVRSNDSKWARIETSRRMSLMSHDQPGDSIAQIEEEVTRGKASDCEVAVLGAGPYGFSAAAHLKSKGMDFRIFGRPHEFWAKKMPAGTPPRAPPVYVNIPYT